MSRPMDEHDREAWRATLGRPVDGWRENVADREVGPRVVVALLAENHGLDRDTAGRRRVVNGCAVRAYVGDAYVIHHPTGWMVYRGWRVGTRRHLASAIALAKSTDR